MSAPTEIRLLGRFSVRQAGREVQPSAFGQRLVRTLVRVLLIHRGSFVANDLLTEALWPRRPPANPAANLRVFVTRARRALGNPSLIATAAGGYAFIASHECVVDTEVFLARVETGGMRLSAGQPVAALREFREALEKPAEYG